MGKIEGLLEAKLAGLQAKLTALRDIAREAEDLAAGVHSNLEVMLDDVEAAKAPQPVRLGFALSVDQIDQLRRGWRLKLQHEGHRVELRSPEYEHMRSTMLLGAPALGTAEVNEGSLLVGVGGRALPDPVELGFQLRHKDMGHRVELRPPHGVALVGDACDPAQPPEHERIVVHDPNDPDRRERFAVIIDEAAAYDPATWGKLDPGYIMQLDPMSGDPVAAEEDRKPSPSEGDYRKTSSVYRRMFEEEAFKAFYGRDLIFGGAMTSQRVPVEPGVLTWETIEEVARKYGRPAMIHERLPTLQETSDAMERQGFSSGERPAYDGRIEPGMIFLHNGSIPQRYAVVTKIRGDQVHWVDCEAKWPETSQTERYFRRDVPEGSGPYMACPEALAMVEAGDPEDDNRGEDGLCDCCGEPPDKLHVLGCAWANPDGTDIDEDGTEPLTAEEEAEVDRLVGLSGLPRDHVELQVRMASMEREEIAAVSGVTEAMLGAPPLRTKEPGVVPENIAWPTKSYRMGKSIEEMNATERCHVSIKIDMAQKDPSYPPSKRHLAWIEEHVGPVPELVRELQG